MFIFYLHVSSGCCLCCFRNTRSSVLTSFPNTVSVCAMQSQCAREKSWRHAMMFQNEENLKRVYRKNAWSTKTLRRITLLYIHDVTIIAHLLTGLRSITTNLVSGRSFLSRCALRKRGSGELLLLLTRLWRRSLAAKTVEGLPSTAADIIVGYMTSHSTKLQRHVLLLNL